MDYGGLRAQYDAAFGRLRRAEQELRSIRQQLSPDGKAEEAARQRFESAMGAYRACRKNLVDALLSHESAGGPAVMVDSRPPAAWTGGGDRRAAGSDNATRGRRQEITVLAYRLWEEAGRPLGRADEHWFRAEEMLRSGQ